MLQNIGDKLKSHRWLGAGLLGILAIIFTLWGAYGVVDLSFGAPNYALKINGEEVPVATVQNAWQQRQSQIQQQIKDDIPPEQRKILQQQLLDGYVDSTLINARARERGLRVGTVALQRAYQNEPAFQVDGKFNEQFARGLLAQSGLTAAAYEAQLRQQLQSQRLVGALQATGFLTETELRRIFALENEQRELRYAVVPVARFESGVNVEPAKVQAWYETHKDEYQSTESARIQYAELSLATVAASVSVNADDLAKWYEANKTRYAAPEKRHARHILIALSETDAKDAAKAAAAEKKAREVLEQARAGKDFVQLARQYSDDTGSKAAGGDLGWLNPGASIDKTFSAALFAMKRGEISNLVKTPFGYHIIKLDDVQAAATKTLADARATIEADYRKDRAAELFGERQEGVQRKLEQNAATDLAALAREFNLQTGEIANWTRAGAAPLGNSADLNTLIFASGNAKGDRLLGPVALGADRMVLVRVLEHRPAQVRPLPEVQAAVVAAVRKDAASVAARAAAAEAVKKLQAGAEAVATFKALNLNPTAAAWVGRGDPQLPVQVRDMAFALPATAGKAAYSVVALDSGDAAIVAVSGVRPGVAGANSVNDQRQAQQYIDRERQVEFNAYQQEMRRTATIRRNEAVFN
jgi:peptidyl-prolyl cis-trans isomerase D